MLAPGSRIAVVAPAGGFSPERLSQGIETVRGWGYSVVLAPHLEAAGPRHRYLSATREQRQADLAWALTAHDIDAVWFARGGFGTAHLLADLPWDRVDQRPILGFSDATALFGEACRRRLRAIHAPVLQGLADYDLLAEPSSVRVDPESRLVLRHLLATGVSPFLPGEPLCGPKTSVRGRVVGGNLSVIASTCGTPWALQAKGCVLALEDTREAPYRIDRLLTQLQAAGTLEGVVGVALGQFDHCAPEHQPWTLREVLHDLLAPLGVPVVAGLPFGHTAHNYAFELGREGQLTAEGLRFT